MNFIINNFSNMLAGVLIYIIVIGNGALFLTSKGKLNKALKVWSNLLVAMAILIILLAIYLFRM